MAEVEDLLPSSIPVSVHPLAGLPESSRRRSTSLKVNDPIGSGKSSESKPVNEFIDPLGACFQNSGQSHSLSPLEPRILKPQSNGEETFSFEKLVISEKEEWEEKKMKFLNHFSSNDTINVSLNFDITILEPKGQDWLSSRLEEIEDISVKEEKEHKIITQKECIRTLRNLNDEIAHAWFRQEKVLALRLAVKVTKLLSDKNIPASFYPTLFVLTTEILDTISELVWQRLKEKAEKDENGNLLETLPENFTCKDVKPEAQEIARNWFKKISSVKELLPRIYMEIAILKCAFFFDPFPSLFIKRFERLSAMIRGVSDPIFSSFVKIYLLRKAAFCVPFSNKDMLSDEEVKFYFNDFSLFSMNEFSLPPSNPRGFVFMLINDHARVFSEFLNSKATKKDSTFQILDLTTEYMTHFIFKNSSEAFLKRILYYMLKPSVELAEEKVSDERKELVKRDPLDREEKNDFPNLFIYYFLKFLPTNLLFQEKEAIFRFIEKKFDPSCSQHKILSLVIEKCKETKFTFEENLSFFNKIMQMLSSYSLLDEFLEVTNSLLEFVAINCTENELQLLIKATFFKIKNLKTNEIENKILYSFLERILNLKNNLTYLFSLPFFPNLIEYLHGELRVSILKQCFSIISRNMEIIKSKNSMLIFFEYAKILHDSLDVFSVEDERKQIANLVSRFILQVEIESNVDVLNFLIDCRQQFHSTDIILERLVHCANRLSILIMKKWRLVNDGRPEDVYDDENDDGVKITNDNFNDDERDDHYEALELIKSMFAFTLVSIPSITKSLLRCQLFLSSAQVAHQCKFFFISELCFKKALLCLNDESFSSEISSLRKEDDLVLNLNNILSFLFYKADNPQLPKMLVLNQLQTFINNFTWSKPGLRKAIALNSILSFLSRFQHVHYCEQDNDKDVKINGNEEKVNLESQYSGFVDVPSDFISDSVSYFMENEKDVKTHLDAIYISISNQIVDILGDMPPSKAKGDCIVRLLSVYSKFSENSITSEIVDALLKLASPC